MFNPTRDPKAIFLEIIEIDNDPFTAFIRMIRQNILLKKSIQRHLSNLCANKFRVGRG
ncbi:hypothetical protein ALTER154_70426 [Alteromonas sp. 154]|nr:hypothetical protein ALTER154_70426 [Alteromonas sp. 154]